MEKQSRGIDVYLKDKQKRKELAQAHKRAREQSGQHEGAKKVSVPLSNRPPKDFIPKGWIEAPSVGEPILFFIPSKTPISQAYEPLIPPDKYYNPNMAIQLQRKSQRHVALILNLTKTTAYYAPKRFEEQSIQVVQIKCQGRGQPPTPEQVNEFLSTVRTFNGEQAGAFILIHCTHGFNRTGIMICHALMRLPSHFKSWLTVTEALNVFKKARPPGIYKPLYIDSLYEYYHEKKDESVYPKVPEWKEGDIEGDEDDDPENSDDDADEVLDEEMNKQSQIKHHDDVLGERVTEREADELKYLVMQLVCDPQELGSTRQYFPGSQPVSLSRMNLDLLMSKRYYVTWKADGTRYMLLLMNDGVFLINRSFEVRRVQMRFPIYAEKDKKPSFMPYPHDTTLLDGEMVIDEDHVSKKKCRRFYVYDMMALNGRKVTDKEFKFRYGWIEQYIIMPRAMERALIRSDKPYKYNYDYDAECFQVKRKGFYPLHTSASILNVLIPKKLLHESDGLIFQGWEDEYVPFTFHELLKWKYSHLNSADFYLDVIDNGEEHAYLLSVGNRGKLEPLEDKVVFPAGVEAAHYDKQIIECAWRPQFDSWEFMRLRTDKKTPNDKTVYQKVWESIKDNINEDELLSFVKESCKLDLYQNDRNRKVVI